MSSIAASFGLRTSPSKVLLWGEAAPEDFPGSAGVAIQVRVDTRVEGVEARIDPIEPGVHTREPIVDVVEPSVHAVEPRVHPSGQRVHPRSYRVDPGPQVEQRPER